MQVSVRNLCKRFGRSVAARSISFGVAQGKFLTLLGPSGSGKTTMLMMIAGFVEPDSGTIEVADRDITRLPANKRDLGVVFQSYALFPHKTVWENIAFPLQIRKVPRADVERRVGKLIELVRLGSFKDHSVTVLSGGQRQRVALARAIVFEPPVLLMDEPLGALDRKLREHMQSEIKNIQSELNVTTIYVTHDQDEALAMSDTIAIMNEGQIVQLDNPQQLYENPTNRFVAEFLGGINLLAVQAVTREGENLVADLGHGVRVPCSARGATELDCSLLGIRPERLQLGQPNAHSLFNAVVVKRTYLGGAVVYELRHDDIALAARVSTDSSPMLSVGSNISISWPAQSAWLLS